MLNRLADTSQLLPYENREEFLQPFDSLEVCADPQTAWDYRAVHQAAVLTWDILR